jgi:cytochrome c556
MAGEPTLANDFKLMRTRLRWSRFSHALVGDLRLRSLLKAARSASYRRALGESTGYHTLRSRSSRIDAGLFSRTSSLDFPPVQSHDDFLVFFVRLEILSNREFWMRPLFCVAGVFAVLIMAGLVSGPAGATSDDETPSIKKVMSKLHKGKTAPLSVLKTALKGESPDWTTVQKEAKTYATYSAAMPKNDPPRGEKESYETLAKAYASAGKSLEESAEKEELKGSRDALKTITNSCMACHKNHRPS